MAIEALKRIFQVPVIKKEREISLPSYRQKKPKPKKEDAKEKGKIDIKV